MTYDITMRDDIVFSDGVPVTIDDVIFTMYVYLDPTYDGAVTLYAMPITGLDAYRSGMSTLSELLMAAGPDNTDFTYWTEETQTDFWADVNAAGEQFAQEIVDVCVESYIDYASEIDATPEEILADEGLQVKFGMALWGFGDYWTEGATAADYWAAIMDAYEGDVMAASETESAGSGVTDFIEGYDDKYSVGVSTGESAPNVAGIVKTGDYSMTLTLDKIDATAVYQLLLPIAPIHYYGDTALYDYDNNMFGFNKGDMSLIKAKTTQPFGAGSYTFVSYENGIVTLQKNENYYEGAPKIDYVLFKEGADADKLTGVATGAFDISDPSFNTAAVTNIKGYNANGETTGDQITTITVDNLGYGYLGICAENVKVGEDSGSAESKALRKGFMTLFSVHRDTVIDSYYGEIAAIINYPISNTSWAAPRPTDEGYEIAYSTDVDGNAIYTAEMTEDEKYDAALQAAIGFFKAAGYTWDEATGTFTEAPEGASMTYEIIIPGDGTGDHPAYGILTAVKDQLAGIGITLEINDPADSNILWDKLDAGSAEMWTAAWQATADPDMYQVYHSSNVVGLEGSSNSNHYAITDAEMDTLIMDARSTTDQAYRKATYKECLNIVLDWAVELPTYQRQNAYIFSTERVNIDTITPDMTPFWTWLRGLETLEMN